ncbi:glycosyltransferase family 2 protein [Paenisporosarcina indica]|uniref:glycosyltransferase family 2 protein n=1 Tax=Paenisporosarcina indica TaxID=650093 RepID=UPI00094FD00F|nr:glycosyltransferase [Paenisporosarcina indica]
MKPTLSIIITGKADDENLEQLFRVAQNLHYSELILLLSGSSNNKDYLIYSNHDVKVLHFGSEIISHKMRVHGAKIAKGNILLFMDTKFLINFKEIRSLILCVENKKADLALSTFSDTPQPGVINFESVEYILNIISNRRDLLCSSLYNVPFAISREALKIIGADSLAVPPLAKMNAIKKGLVIEVFNHSKNNLNKLNEKEESLIMEEFLQSTSSWLNSYGRRSGYTNLGRRFDVLELQNYEILSYHSGVTAIISASNEEETIGNVIRSAFDAGATQVVVVENGSTDATAKIAKEAGAKVLSFSYRLGHDVGRGVGALNFPSAHYLFLDGDMVLSVEELIPFITAVTKGGIDVALNNLSNLVKHPEWDEVTWSKFFLNNSLSRKDLDVNTLTAVPHAINGRAVNIIGVANLAVPTIAMVRAVLSGLTVKAIREVDVISKNRIRSELHYSSRGNLVEQLIIGDMCQGLYEIILQKHGRVI